MTAMKIALLVPGGVDRSGTERVIPCLLWLIERLARGHQLHVFALHQESEPGRWELLGAPVVNAGRRPRRLRALAQLLAENRRARFDLVHGFWAGGPGVVAALFGRLARVPSVLTLPGGDLVAMPDIGYGARLSARGRAATSLAFALADRVTVPSHFMVEQAARLGVAAQRIPLGVATDRWPVRPPARRVPGKLRLLHVANLNRVKDQDMLLAAMQSLCRRGVDFQLDIVGLDCLDGAVQWRSAELGVADRVRFHGFMTHDRLRSAFEQADLLVMSSRHEGVPIVMAEAAIAGVPTVGTAVGQIADWSPRAAVAVPVGDCEGLADAIQELDGDEDRRLRMATAAQRIAVAEDADFTARETVRLYRQLLSRQR